jgi:hypothetical protein
MKKQTRKRLAGSLERAEEREALGAETKTLLRNDKLVRTSFLKLKLMHKSTDPVE